jgi:MinD-like ATPase involved in chromosome partitioning or flagellar assembly/DNA-binding MarR family transcriptional regulator
MSQIISVQSLRHGTGKSHLVSNLAVNMAQEGSRVGIIDTGFRPPGVHALFGLDDDKTDYTLNYYLWNHNTPDDPEIAANLAYKVGSGQVVVIGGQVHLASINTNLRNLVSHLQQDCDITALSQDFFELMERLKLDYLLIDSRPEINEESLFYMAIADTLMLVLSLDDQTFQGIAVTIDIARRLGVPQIRLVVNQLPLAFDINEVQQELEQTFREAVVGVLPFSEEMLQFASRGIFCLEYPNHPLSANIQAIARQLIYHDSNKNHTLLNSLNSDVLHQTASSLKPELTSFDTLDLPDLHRQIINWIVHHGSVSLLELASYLEQTENAIYPIVAMLVEQGLIEPLEIQGQRCYRLRLTDKQTHPLSEQTGYPLQDNTAE